MSWLSGEKERKILFQLQLQPYIEKVEKTFPDIQGRSAETRRRAAKAEKPADKKMFEALAESYTVEGIARLQWYSDTEESYENYKKSPLWKKIRQSVIQRDEYECQGCGKRTYAGHKRVYDLYAFEVHHMDYRYETMAGLNDGGLITLCRVCHKFIHYAKNGDKRQESEWGNALQHLKEKHAARKREERKTTRLLNQLKNLSAKCSMDGLNSEEQERKSELERELREVVSRRKARRQ